MINPVKKIGVKVVREAEGGRQLEKVMTDSASGSGGGGFGDTSSGFSPTNGHNLTATVNSSDPTDNNSGTVTSPASERETSTSRNSGERLFPFNFDSGRRQLQALSMIQEWARNNVSNLGIPSLGSSSSNDGEPSSIDRVRLARRTQTDTHIMMPSTSGQAGTSASGSSPNVSVVPRSRGSPSHLHRNTVENATETNNGEHLSTGTAANRESFVLDIESGLNSWEHGDNGVGESTRRQSDDVTASRYPIRSDASTPQDANAYPLPTEPAGTPTSVLGGDRTPAEILRDTPETRAVINEINRYTTLRPFLIIMLLKGLMDHGSGIICFLAMLVTLSHANSLLKKEVSKQRKRNLLYLAMITINLVVCAAFIYYVFNDDQLYYALIFMPTKVELTSFWTLLWVVGVSDFVGKFVSVVAKAFIVGLPASVLAFQKRGKYYLFIEQTSQLYRSFLPIHHWLIYLVNSYDGATKMFGMFLAGMYCVFKAADSVQRFKDWNTAFRKLLQNVHYGNAPTAKELDSVGQTCPICHDTFTCPTRLSCTHIFCEECVSTWFDRERTCPMCRAKVVDDPTFRDGSTSQYIQFF